MLWFMLLAVSSTSAVIDQPVNMENWTTCDMFMKNYTHNVSKIVDIEWQIFYSWDGMFQQSYNVWFTKPSNTLVDRYRVQLERELKDVNFDDAELFMESGIDFTALFIRTNTSGVYKIVPHTAFQVPYIPKSHIALKLVEPGYLGIMNCVLQYCYALAPVGKLPRDDQITEAAALLRFYNTLGRSYLTKNTTPKPELTTGYDQDDDDKEFEKQLNTI